MTPSPKGHVVSPVDDGLACLSHFFVSGGQVLVFRLDRDGIHSNKAVCVRVLRSALDALLRYVGKWIRVSSCP